MPVKKKESKEIKALYKAILGSLSVPSREILSAKKLSQTFGIPLEHMEHYLIVLAQRNQILIGEDQGMIWARKKK
jgi:hypothetical protein